MRFGFETLELPPNVFTLLRDLIGTRTGLWYDNDKRDLLADKLVGRVTQCGFDSFLDYYYLLKYDEQAADEWNRLIDALSVQETYFWREVDQIRALAEVVLPEHLARSPLEPFRIWCAACASGEEPLSIAMMLDQFGWFNRAAIEIHASDASLAALEKARGGLYRQRSFRVLSPELQQRYFTPEGDAWRIQPQLHRRIRWTRANLVEAEEVARLAQAQAIFCRNVFIYFSPETISKVVRQFAEHMPSKSYLFVGASESLLRASSDYALQELGNAFVYVRRS